MYLQALLKQALQTLGHAREAENSIHFSYEMVALSHATARELGYETEAAVGDKPFVEVSGRKGLGVKIDDLLDLLTSKASAEVARLFKVDAIDWQKQMVVVVTAGVRPTGGWQIDVKSLDVADNNLTVKWSVTPPAGFATQAFTHPAVAEALGVTYFDPARALGK